MPTLQQLIRGRMDQHGWSYAKLAERSGGSPTRGRWQQLGTGARMTGWPDPDTLRSIAGALSYDETTVVLATAQTLGMNVRARGSTFGQLLPAGTDELSPRMQDALLAMIRAAVADRMDRYAAEEGDPDAFAHLSDGPIIGFSRQDAPSSGGNTLRRKADTD